jgi:hypothetical protein
MLDRLCSTLAISMLTMLSMRRREARDGDRMYAAFDVPHCAVGEANAAAPDDDDNE